jgi:hypothetical protein
LGARGTRQTRRASDCTLLSAITIGPTTIGPTTIGPTTIGPTVQSGDRHGPFAGGAWRISATHPTPSQWRVQKCWWPFPLPQVHCGGGFAAR